MQPSQRSAAPTSLCLVMPLFDNAPHLPAVLAPIVAALGRGAIDQVIVIDDGSTDDGPARCRALGLTVHPSGGRKGPAACRNQGARLTTADILLFVDSDVVIHDDVPERVRATFEREPQLAAMFGSYDANPVASGIVSRYRNLLHHWVHQHGNPDASTFWAGCGAIRREAFHAVGGFDPERYPRPSIEDIELGYRLRQNGHLIRLDPNLQCTHRKRWTLASMVTTDVFQRALPWARLLLEPGRPLDDLNVTLAERARAVVAGCFWLGLGLSPFASSPFRAWAILIAALALVLAVLVNRGFFGLVWRTQGPRTAVAAVLLHQLYYLYSSAVFGYCAIERLWRRSPAARARHPTDEHIPDHHQD